MIEVKTEAGNLLVDAIFGFSMSAIVSGIMPEAIHAVTTIVTGLTLTICVFFTNRFLKKRFPDGKKDN